jgi:regulator of sigma E protease
MLAGVIFNFILAILIYAGIAFCWGEKTIAFENATEGLDYVPAAQKIGFQNGDIPLLADGVKIDVSERNFAMRMVEADVVTVLRNHTDTVNINIPDDFIFQLNDDEGFFAYRTPVYVQKLSPGEPAEKAGLQEGDHIVSVNGTKTPSFTEFSPALMQLGGKETTIGVMRGDSLINLTVTPTESGKIGIQLRAITDIYPIDITQYSFFESFPKGWEIGVSTLSTYVGSMKHLFSAEGAQSIGGFGAIGSIFPDTWNWLSFWEITAFLSVVLAFMNVLPIPALDGGHVLFLLYEIIARRKPSDKFLEYAQIAGMVFIFGLLIYANGNDIYRFFFK